MRELVRSIPTKVASKLRFVIDNYDFAMHPTFKSFGNSLDNTCYGVDTGSLLLFFGDLSGARRGLEKMLDSHRHIAALISQGKAAANEPLAENAAGLPPAQTTGASAFLP